MWCSGFRGLLTGYISGLHSYQASPDLGMSKLNHWEVPALTHGLILHSPALSG